MIYARNQSGVAYSGLLMGWSTIKPRIGPSVAVQAVSRSDDGTTIIIDFFSFLFFFSSFLFLSFYRHR